MSIPTLDLEPLHTHESLFEALRTLNECWESGGDQPLLNRISERIHAEYLHAEAFQREGVQVGDYCPFDLVEDLLRPIASQGNYAGIANRFRSMAGSSLSAFCGFGRNTFSLGSPQAIKNVFAAFAKLACVQMGYRGTDPLRFFLYQLRLWYCRDFQNVGGRDFKSAAGCRRPIGIVVEHWVTLEIKNIFEVAANYCDHLEWTTERSGKEEESVSPALEALIDLQARQGTQLLNLQESTQEVKQSIVSLGEQLPVKRRRHRTTEKPSSEEAIWIECIKSDKEGPEFCSLLDERQAAALKWRGGDKMTYSLAYRRGCADQIQQRKSYLTTKFKLTTKRRKRN